jgi:diguanylate cyclase (GGDEF)-like protein/putative nucleotidyltransferase with HDIG domain
MMVSVASEDHVAPAQAGAGAGAQVESSLMAKMLAGLFAAGATLALLTAALPHSAQASTLGLLLIVANAYLVAAILFWRAGTLPSSILPLALAWGSTLIAGVAYCTAQSPSPLVFFFLWIFLYSSYFFTVTETAVQIAYVGVVYGVLLALRSPPAGIAEWWLVGMGSLLVGAVVIRSMRERGEMLVARLYEAARTDPLTKLANRSGFRELLDLELERARRGDAVMSVVVGDIDHFKEINDHAGQRAGDAALERLAGVLRDGRRQIDGLARVGGAEFALVLPDTGAHQAFVLAERLRDQCRVEFSRDVIPLTISFGIAAYPEHGQTAGSLLRATDEALHTAKRNGRDRSVLYSQALRDASAHEGGTRDVAGERFVAVVLDLAEAVDLRFSGSARHSETVGRYAAMTARELGLAQQRTERVRIAGILHDIGKVGISDAILQKPGKLTGEEYETIKKHPELGAQILQHPSLADIRQWVGAHHERPDGCGYPLGLAAEEIPLEAQILAVADAYEAMTSDRSYRSSIGHVAARAELQRCAGTQFDATVVAALLAVLEREAHSQQVGLTPPHAA